MNNKKLYKNINKKATNTISLLSHLAISRCLLLWISEISIHYIMYFLKIVTGIHYWKATDKTVLLLQVVVCCAIGDWNENNESIQMFPIEDWKRNCLAFGFIFLLFFFFFNNLMNVLVDLIFYLFYLFYKSK